MTDMTDKFEIYNKTTENNNFLEVHNETIDEIFTVSTHGELISEILNITVIPKIKKKYYFRSPLMVNGILSEGFNTKLLVLITYDFEYIPKGPLGEIRSFRREKLINVVFTMPSNYTEGKTVNIISEVFNVHHKLLNPNTIYLSSYVSFFELD